MTPEREAKLTAVLQKRQAGLTVVLENIEDPHNVSAVLRSCDAVGIQEIFVLNTKPPWRKRWGPRSSSSAANWVTVHQFEHVGDCVKEVRSRFDKILTTHLASDAVSLYQLDLTERIALVFGNEREGLSKELLAAADGNFMIPQVGVIRSLNISVACAVTIYEAYRQRSEKGMYAAASLPEEKIRALRKEWKFYDRETSDQTKE